MFPTALKTLSDGVRVAQMHIYLQVSLEQRKSTLVVAPLGEWIYVGVNGLFLQVSLLSARALLGMDPEVVVCDSWCEK